eukprot:TRINITY_DN3182_c0_g1_i2.p1 TRINITY_DN3182_c0_g1~~TRINITY_DN3182_c0_g1_i2.p1  ORF type:complete len:1247 (+),score=282.14 TRINITY_DN3182_c0_g1_i2:103-3741(+)
MGPTRRAAAFGALLAAAHAAPESHLQTILWWDCDGTFRMFPDNPLLSVVAQVPMAPRVYEAGAKGLFSYIKAHCDAAGGSPKSTEPAFLNSFLNRFMPLHVAAHVNRLWTESPVGWGDNATTSGLGRWMCVDSLATFTRDLVKLWESLTGGSAVQLPESCRYYKLQKGGARYTGECALGMPLRPLKADLQFKVKQCPNSEFGYFSGYLGCSGVDCNIGRPCSAAAGCGSGGTLTCSDVFNYPAGDPLFTEDDILNGLQKIKLFGPHDTVASRCGSEHGPRKLLQSFFGRFAKELPNTPEATGAGSSCQGNTCSVCLPEKTSTFSDVSDKAFDGFIDEQPGFSAPPRKYWNSSSPCGEISQYDSDPFAESFEGRKLREFPRANAYWYLHPDVDRTDVVVGRWWGYYARGAPYQLGGLQTVFGGGSCSSNADCNTINDKQEDDHHTCESLADFCGRSTVNNHWLIANGKSFCPSDYCFNDTSGNGTWRCAPKPGLDAAERACTCTARIIGTALVHGERCNILTTTPGIKTLGRSYYMSTPKKWVLQHLEAWDGAKAPDGLDPFTARDHWAQIQTTAPKGESHLASLQCDGTVHMFQGTPYAVTAKHALLADIVAWWSDYAWSTWQCRKPDMTVDEFRVANTLPWRPEGWLWAKVYESGKSVPQPPDNAAFPSILLADYFIRDPRWGLSQDWYWLMERRDLRRYLFDWEHMFQFTPDFALSKWIASAAPDSAARYVGMRWEGTRAALGTDFAATVRVQECATPASAGGGLTRIDLTCSGEACSKYLRLHSRCAKAGDQCAGSIGVKLTCQDGLSSSTWKDGIPEMLWGTSTRDAWLVDDQKLLAYMRGTEGKSLNFAQTSRCPSLEPLGTERLSTSMAGDKQKALLYGFLTGIMGSVLDGDCQACTQGECRGNCRWEGGKCISSTVTSSPPLWCFPDAWTEENTRPAYTTMKVEVPSGRPASVYPQDSRYYYNQTTVGSFASEFVAAPKAELVGPQWTCAAPAPSSTAGAPGAPPPTPRPTARSPAEVTQKLVDAGFVVGKPVPRPPAAEEKGCSQEDADALGTITVGPSTWTSGLDSIVTITYSGSIGSIKGRSHLCVSISVSVALDVSLDLVSSTLAAGSVVSTTTVKAEPMQGSSDGGGDYSMLVVVLVATAIVCVGFAVFLVQSLQAPRKKKGSGMHSREASAELTSIGYEKQWDEGAAHSSPHSSPRKAN